MTKPTHSAVAAREIWGLACQGELTGEEQIQGVIDKHIARGDESIGEVVSLDSKPPETKWVADAMREIVDFICDQGFLFRDDVRQMLTEKAVAIIDKYRPPEEKHPMYAISQDGAGATHIERVETPKETAGELLAAACYVAKGFVYVVCQDRNEDPNDTVIYRSICNALAAYEKEKL